MDSYRHFNKKCCFSGYIQIFVVVRTAYSACLKHIAIILMLCQVVCALSPLSPLQLTFTHFLSYSFSSLNLKSTVTLISRLDPLSKPPKALRAPSFSRPSSPSISFPLSLFISPLSLPISPLLLFFLTVYPKSEDDLSSSRPHCPSLYIIT